MSPFAPAAEALLFVSPAVCSTAAQSSEHPIGDNPSSFWTVGLLHVLREIRLSAMTEDPPVTSLSHVRRSPVPPDCRASP